jgi:hypothetical protein
MRTQRRRSTGQAISQFGSALMWLGFGLTLLVLLVVH